MARARRQIQSQQWPGRGAIVGVSAELGGVLSSRISTHIDTPNRPLGIRPGTAGAVAIRGPGRTGPLISPPSHDSPLDDGFGLDLFRLFGTASSQGTTAGRARHAPNRVVPGFLRGPANGDHRAVWVLAGHAADRGVAVLKCRQERLVDWSDRSSPILTCGRKVDPEACDSRREVGRLPALTRRSAAWPRCAACVNSRLAAGVRGFRVAAAHFGAATRRHPDEDTPAKAARRPPN